METFKKRQKASERREKQQKKAARRLERRLEKAKSPNKNEEGDSSVPQTGDSLSSTEQNPSESPKQAI